MEPLPFPERNCWSDSTVVCIASGPSLTADDCRRVHRWHQGAAGRYVIVTNNTYQLYPWADVLYGMDRKWWEHYLNKVIGCGFKGEMMVFDFKPIVSGNRQVRPTEIRADNSGSSAVALAAHCGAKRIVLLGYDMQRSGGRSHWHGDHIPENLRSMPFLDIWATKFARLLKTFKHIEVINCSRQTRLTCCPCMPLDEALGK